MSRMSGPRRARIFEYLVERDGRCCFIGGEILERNKLVIDHWDNNNSNNHPQNLHLLCKSANAIKNARGPGKKTKLLSSVCVKRPPGLIARPTLVCSNMEAFGLNRQTEPLFRHVVFYNVVHFCELNVNELVDAGAELVRCSPITIQRYLQKMTSRAGLYRYTGSQDEGNLMIRLKPEWEVFRKRNQENKILNEQANNWKSDFIVNPNLTPNEDSLEPPF